MIKIILSFAILLSGCATDSPVPNEQAIYQKDLIINDGNQKIVGLGVLDSKSLYNFRFESRHNPNLVTISNCHRHVVYRNQKKNFGYDFSPNRPIENGACVLEFEFLDENGFHQFGALAFREPDERIPAEIICNGDKPRQAIGASTCQGKADTIQSIEFAEEMKVKTECDMPISKDQGKTWIFKIKEGHCLFLFKSTQNQYHKLITFGYNDLIKQ